MGDEALGGDRHLAILLTLCGYNLILLGIGLVVRGRNRDAEDFYLGGRRLGSAVAALSAAASSSSAWTLLGVSGAAYAWGLSALWIFPGCVGGFLLNWFLLAPRLARRSRERGAVTVTEMVAGSRGAPGARGLRVAASSIILFSLSVYVASQFQGAGKALHETFGLSEWASIVLGAAVIVAYTLLGGFWAVSLTDTVQGVVMAGAALALPVAALVAVGGFEGLARGLEALRGEGMLSLTRNLPAPAAVGLVAGLLGIGLGYPGQPHVVNRFMAMRPGASVMRRARIIAISWAVIVYAGMLLLGLCGRILYPSLGDGELVFVTAANDLFSPIVSGVLIAAVLSAIMSTADSQLLVAASALTHDLGLGRGSAGASLRISRWVVVGLSLVAVLGALAGSREIFTPVLFAWTAMGSAFGPLLLVTVLKGDVRWPASLAAMVAGFVASVAAYSFSATRGGAVERILPFAISLAIAWWGSRRGPASDG